jgi:membrane fusion protein (multidrug efflux system)
MAAVSAGMLSSCGKKDGPPPAPPTPEVSVIAVGVETVPLTSELPGRISAVRESQVRARATGILQKRLFEEGANVKEGDVLFEIDPLPLQATLSSMQASYAKTQATLKEAQARLSRYKELVAINAVSKQAFDEATASAAQSEAELLANKAAIETAQLNLGYAKVTAPISGRIGRALVTEGALVSATEATQLAVIRQMDPVYFDFTQSSMEVLRLRRAVESGAIQSVAPGEAKVTLVLEDGTVYPNTGKLLFTDIAVDPTTAMITLRAQFPNPGGHLMPGMFARVRIVEGINANAVTVPQRTIGRGTGGSATVLVVNDQNKVELRNIDVERTVGNKAVVSKGLKAGERVMVEGMQKAPPGATVKTVPFNPASTNSAVQPKTN